MMRARTLNWLLIKFDGIGMQPWRTTQVYPSNHWKKSMVELLSKGHNMHISKISDFNLIPPRNHTPAILTIQAEVRSVPQFDAGNVKVR